MQKGLRHKSLGPSPLGLHDTEGDNGQPKPNGALASCLHPQNLGPEAYFLGPCRGIQ